MFRYFPNNYVWNLSVDLAIEAGARIGEIEEICAPLLEASGKPDAEGTRAFMQTWVAMGDKLCGLADDDIRLGRAISASDKQLRAVVYYLIAERMQGHGAPGRKFLYEKLLRVFQQAIERGQVNCERVQIPHGGSYLAGLYVRAPGSQAVRPCSCR